MKIVITGTSRGIGYELVRAFLSENGHHVLAISRNTEPLEKLLPGNSGVDTTSKLDIVSFDFAELPGKEIDFRKLVLDKMPKIDILVNNAGTLINKLFSDLAYEELLETFHINTFVPAMISRLLSDCMGENNKGHIVNISSMGGVQGSAKFSGLSMYSSSKGALAVLTECMAEEFKDKNISVNCLALGSVQTEMLEQAFPGYKAQVSASGMAAYIKDFALSGNKYFNGKILPVSISTP